MPEDREVVERLIRKLMIALEWCLFQVAVLCKAQKSHRTKWLAATRFNNPANRLRRSNRSEIIAAFGGAARCCAGLDALLAVSEFGGTISRSPKLIQASNLCS